MTSSRGIPRTMRAAVTREPGQASIEEMPVPSIEPGDLLVRTACVGICAGDTAGWYVARKVPAVLGHEPAGTVVAVGEDVDGFAPGDRVFFHHHAPCFRCRDCEAGRPTLCATWRSSRLHPGALAEYVRVPRENVADTLVLPDGVAFEDAALIEPLACCVKAYDRVDLVAGEAVLVIGLGSMGQLLVALANERGASIVVGADFVASRREKALAMGASTVVDPSAESLPDALRAATGGRLADVVIVGPGDVRAMRAGLEATQPGGRWCCFWPTPLDVELPISPFDCYFRELTLHFAYSCGPNDTREALRLIEKGVVRASQLVTHRFPLADTQLAFDITRSAGDSIKTIVVVDPAAR
jgi:L-iditol 2-dehydrogenase